MTWASTREFGSSVTWDGDKYLLNDSTTIVSTLPSEKRNILLCLE